MPLRKPQLNRLGLCAWPEDAQKPIVHDESLTGDGSEAAPLSAADAIAAALDALIQEAEDEATAASLSAANPGTLYVVPEEEA
jgi:hypothetical protein